MDAKSWEMKEKRNDGNEIKEISNDASRSKRCTYVLIKHRFNHIKRVKKVIFTSTTTTYIERERLSWVVSCGMRWKWWSWSWLERNKREPATTTWVNERLHGHVILTNLDHSMKLAFDDGGESRSEFMNKGKRERTEENYQCTWGAYRYLRELSRYIA